MRIAYWLKMIFLPWLVIRQERIFHENEIEVWRAWVNEADPDFLRKKEFESYVALVYSNPRMNFEITNIRQLD